MGNREDLLAGAKRCLYEKGYARTTARDIAGAAGTSLAAIGYHFRSKEALLNEALFEAMAEWADAVGDALTADTDPDATPAQRFALAWARIVESFDSHRQLWTSQLDLVAQLDHLPGVRDHLRDGQPEARLGLAELFGYRADTRDAAALGSLLQILLGGLLMRWLVDPKDVPSGQDLADAVRALATRLA
jgi:AcrR family transcriptional regulator